MADESQYPSDTYSNKRKYEEQTAPPPSTRRSTGFSSGLIPSASPDPAATVVPPPSSYNNVPPLMDEIQMSKQKDQEIAARLLNSADAKRPRVENGASYDYGDKGFSSYPSAEAGGSAGSGGGGHRMGGQAENHALRFIPGSDYSGIIDALHVAFGTSHVALVHRARLTSGQVLLVLGAAGGVGLATDQIGKVSGAIVIAVARGTEKIQLLKSMGVDHVVDQGTENVISNVKEFIKTRKLRRVDVLYVMCAFNWEIFV